MGTESREHSALNGSATFRSVVVVIDVVLDDGGDEM